MERYNRRKDDEGNDVEAKLLQKYLDFFDGYCIYDNGVLKINFVRKVVHNHASGQCHTDVPKKLLKQIWKYYDLDYMKFPETIRIYLMFKVNEYNGGIK
jgi:hypothetical protein